MKTRFSRFLPAVLPLLLLAPMAANAITLLPPCTKSGDCGVTDILAVFLNIGEYLLGISGAIALAYFIYGGFRMVLSAGRSGEVQAGKDTIVRATIGIFIIFLSGVLVRFTQLALIGPGGNVCLPIGSKAGSYSVDGTEGGASCVPAVGMTCSSGNQSKLWVSVPAGFSDPNDPAGTFIKEGLVCIATDDCASLNTELTNRNRIETSPKVGGYTCTDVSSPNVLSCVRGLCGSKPSGFACCLCNDGHGQPTKCGGSS